MRSERNANQLDNPNNPELENRPCWRVVKPETKIYKNWRLGISAEAREGQVGIEVQSLIDFYDQTQRRLRFQDGAEYWFYPQWLEKVC